MAVDTVTRRTTNDRRLRLLLPLLQGAPGGSGGGSSTPGTTGSLSRAALDFLTS